MKPYVVLVGADIAPPRTEVEIVVRAHLPGPFPKPVCYREVKEPLNCVHPDIASGKKKLDPDTIPSNKLHYLSMEDLARLNDLSDIRLVCRYSPFRFDVFAWTNELDENDGNLKGCCVVGPISAWWGINNDRLFDGASWTIPSKALRRFSCP